MTTHYTSEHDFTCCAAADMMESAAEMIDGRFAVIAERLYEVTGYNRCADGHSYDIVTVHAAPDTYNPSNQIPLAGDFIEAWVFVDMPDYVANRKFGELIRARLEEAYRG